MPATLDDVVAAIEELAEKAEIQASNFDQKTPVDVGTSPTLILDTNEDRKGFYLSNKSDVVIYLGNSAVTTSDGIEFVPGDVMSEENLPLKGKIYGRVGSGTAEVRIVEET